MFEKHSKSRCAIAAAMAGPCLVRELVWVPLVHRLRREQKCVVFGHFAGGAGSQTQEQAHPGTSQHFASSLCAHSEVKEWMSEAYECGAALLQQLAPQLQPSGGQTAPPAKRFSWCMQSSRCLRQNFQHFATSQRMLSPWMFYTA